MKKVQLTIGDSTNRQSQSSKTTAQTLQRILVKAVGTAYAKLKDICFVSLLLQTARRLSSTPSAMQTQMQ